METTKRWTLIALGLALSAITPLSLAAQEADQPKPAADPALLLKAIPADATAFVALRSLQELDDDVQTTWKNLKLPEGVVPSLVDWVRGGLQLGENLNAGGSMAVVVLNLSEVKSPDEIPDRLALFFPAKDPEAMAKSMGGEKDGEVIKLELAGKPSVAAAKQGFLVVAKDEAALKASMKATGDGVLKSLTPERQKSFAAADIYGWANFRGVSKELRGAARQAIEDAGGGGMIPAPLMALQKGNFEQLEKILNEGEEVAFGVSLDPKRGITVNFAMVMQPDSELGKQMAAMKPATGSLLVGLPGEPTILAMGTVGNPSSEEQIRKLFDDLLQGEGIEESVDKEKLGKVRDLLAQLAGAMQQASIGISALPAEDAQGMIGLTIVGTVRNSQQFKQQAKELFTAVKDLVVDAAQKSGEPEDQVKQVADALQWKEGAEKVGEANVDHLTFDLSKLPDLDPDTLDQVKKVLGSEGLLLRVASVDATHVAVTFGGGAKRFETIAGLVAKGEAPLAASADIKKVADRVPAGAKLVEGYVSIDQLLDLVMNIGNEVGAGIPFPLKMRNSAPIAFSSVKAGEAGQQVEVLVPMEMMRSIADMVRPILGMMMGGPPEPSEDTEPSESGSLQ